MKRILFLTISLIMSLNLLINYDIHSRKAYAIDEPPAILNVKNIKIC